MVVRMTKVRVLLWSPQGAGLHYSGAGKNAYRLYQNFDRERFTVSLAHGYPEHERMDLFDEQYYIADATQNTPLKLLNFLRCAKRWLKANAVRFDVVHVLDVFEASMRPAGYAKSLGLPVYVKVANSGTGFMNSGRLSRLLNLPGKRLEIAKRLDGLISISTTITGELTSLGIAEDRIYSIPNGVDVERFKMTALEVRLSLRQKLGLEERFTVLFIGEIVPRKQPHVLLEMLERSPQLREQLQVVFLGPVNDAEYGADFFRRLESMEQCANVRYVEYSRRPEDYYQASDAFVLPSKNEGMSNAILEAMASGLPILSTPVSGNDELVFEGVNGYCLQYGSEVEDLVSSLERMLHDPEKVSEMGVASRRIVMDGFDLQSVAVKYMSLFEGVTIALK
jgi:glycosyltransferase involved in cell wall biosynthesis